MSDVKDFVERVVIESVTPCVDGGRHAVKRVLGEALAVGADVYKDGHDLVGARVAFRPPGGTRFSRAPLRYEYAPDRWFGEIGLDRLGRWSFRIEAWPDRFGSWRSELAKRQAAGEDLEPELLEGARLVRARLGRGRIASLSRAAETLAGGRMPLEERIEQAFDASLAQAMEGPLHAEDLTRSAAYEVIVDRELARFGAWYELFPRSEASEPDRHGTFADTEKRLPALADLGFDVVYLPPIHPIGRTFRKGRNNTPSAEPGDPGSPWAIGGEEGGHTAVHPELGTLADFERLVDRAKSLGLEIALDFALQCSPDHPWIREHPDWFYQRPDGTLRYAENPPKKYQDIYPLDFWCEDREALWEACRDALLFWIAHGVRVFRVDNPHTKPLAFWEWAIGEVQREHPDVIFFAEAFTRPKRMYGLAKLGFTQSYTYFTWKNSAWELREYLTELTQSGVAEFFRPNFFANTPDILHEYLQQGGRPAFAARLVLAATLSPSYGIYSGFELCENQPVRPGSEEYLDSEKYQIRQRDWNAPGSLNPLIRRVNRLRRENPALQRLENLTFLGSDSEAILAYHRWDGDNHLLVAVNLDPHGPQETTLEVPRAALGVPPGATVEVEDLLDGARYSWHDARAYVRLDPGVDQVAHVLRVVTPQAGPGAP